MSATPLHCPTCEIDCLYVRIAAVPGEHTYAVEWRCPRCDHHALDLCPIGPASPTIDTCLNCGGALSGPDESACCAGCDMLRFGVLDLFGLDPAPADPIALAETLFDMGLPRRAVATLNDALTRDSALEPAWRIKYAFLSGLGYMNAARAVIEAATEHVVNPDLLISYAHVLQALGRNGDALDVYREYLASAPDGEYADLARSKMQ